MTRWITGIGRRERGKGADEWHQEKVADCKQICRDKRKIGG